MPPGVAATGIPEFTQFRQGTGRGRQGAEPFTGPASSRSRRPATPVLAVTNPRVPAAATRP